MSRNIDEHIVEMRFDNRHFEQNISESLSTIDRLKKSLNFNDASKSFSELERASKNVTLDGMAKSVEELSNRFSTLGRLAMRTIDNIIDSTLRFGKKISSALTIDPLLDGFDEYETKMNAITTILTNTKSKGTTLDEVNAALAELNEYADKTIYNFAEMTRNIGTFTAAGVDLETSTRSIKGIANLAAGSGSSAAQASTAMYQLSQAIANGSVKLQDWNSVINAGMGGELFQNALKQTAKEMGIVMDTSVPFRESLKDGWLSTEVLTRTLSNFAEDADLLKAATEVKTFTQLIDTMKESLGSGWATSWEKIIGDKAESARIFTAISEAFEMVAGAAADARNKMLSFWSENEGRMAVIEGISNVLLGLADVLGPIEKAFRDIFPAMTGKRLVEISKSFRDLTSGFKISEKTADNLGRTFKGIFAILDIFGESLKFVANAVGLVVKAFVPGAGGGILAITGSLGDFAVVLRDSIKDSKFFTDALYWVGQGITKLKNIAGPTLSEIVETITDFIRSLKLSFRKGNIITDALSNMGSVIETVKGIVGPALAAISGYFTNMSESSNFFTDTVTTLSNGLKSARENIENFFSGFKASANEMNSSEVNSGIEKVGLIGTVLDKLQTVASKIKSVLTPVFNFLKEKLSAITMEDIGALLTGGSLLMLAKSIKDVLGGVSDIVDNFAGVVDQLGNTLKSFQLKVKAEALLKIAAAVGLLTLSLIALSFVKPLDIAIGIGALGLMLTELTVAMNMMSKDDAPKRMSTLMIGLGIGLVAMAKAVKIFGEMDPFQLLQGTVALGAMLGGIVLFMDQTKEGDLKKSAGGIKAFATGLVIMSGALALLGLLNINQILQGGAALSYLLAMLGLFIKGTDAGDLKKSAGGLIGFATGIVILSGALAILGKLDSSTLEQGSIALAAMMGVIWAFINTTSEADLKKTAGGLIGFATGIVILTGALIVLGKIDPETLEQGALALGAMVVGIGLFITNTSAGDLKKTAGGLIGFAAGIVILSGALAILGSMPWYQVLIGGLAIATLMASIALFIDTTSAGDLKKSAGGMIGFAAGIMILSVALSVLAKLESDKVTVATLALSGLILVLGLFIEFTSAGDLKKSSEGLIGFAAGLTVLTAAVFILGSMNPDKVIQGGLAVIALMTAIAAFVDLTSGADLAISAKGLTGFAVGLMVLAGVLAILSALNTEKLLMASVAVTSLMVAIGGFVALTNKNDLVASAAGVAAFAIGIALLARALITLSDLDGNQLLVTTAAISALMLVIGLFTATTSGVDLAATALGLVVFSAGLMQLVEALIIIGSVDINTLIVSITALTAVLAVIGVAAAVLTALPLAIVAILALAAALAVLGVGVLAAGKGIESLANGLSVMSTVGKSGAEALVLVFNSLIGLIPSTLAALGKGIIAFALVIANGAPILALSATSVILAIINAITTTTPQVVAAIFKMVSEILKTFVEYIPQIVDAGMRLIVGFMTGIRDHIGDVVRLAIEIVINFINGIAVALPGIIQAGITLMISFINGMADGISNNSEAVIDAVGNLASSIVTALIDGVKAAITGVIDIGGNIVDGLVKGIGNKLKDAKDAAKNLGTSILKAFRKEMDINSPSGKSEDDGMNTVEGYEIGITKNSKSAVLAAKRMAQQVNQAIDTESETTGGTMADALKSLAKNLMKKDVPEAAEGMAKGVSTASEGMASSVGSSAGKAKKAVKTAFEEMVDWIEERKYYNELSLEEELAKWEEVQAKYKEGTEERKKIDREIYRVKKEIRAEDYRDAVDTIDELKFYEKMSTQEELDAWLEIQAKYLEGSEERKKADREVYTLRKQLVREAFDAEVEAINDLKFYNKMSLAGELKAWQKIQSKYTQGTDERKKADREVYSLKQELTAKQKQLDDDYYSRTKALNDQLAQDIKSLNDEYDNAVKSRTDSLYSSYGLFDEVDPLEDFTGDELMKNLDDQVKALEDWTKDIALLSAKGMDEGLIKELQEAGPQSAAQVKALTTLTEEQLTQYAAVWQQKHNIAKTQAVSELESLRIETAEKISAIKLDTQMQLSELTTSWEEATAALLEDSEITLDEMEVLFAESSTTIKDETVTQMTAMGEEIKAIDWPGVGKAVCDGIAAGIRANIETAVQAARELARAVKAATQGVLDIHSPSRVFDEMGRFTVKGFVNGMKAMTGDAIDVASSLGNESILGLQNAIAKIAEFIDSGIDSQPVIRPVLDLSDIADGARRLNSMLNSTSIGYSGVGGRDGNTAKQPINLTINTQTLSQQELDNIFTYVNHRFGVDL